MNFKIAIFTFLLFPFSVRASADKMKVVEHLQFDWDGDGKEDSFDFYLPPDWNDPGQYLKLHIGFANQTQCEINLDAGVANVDGHVQNLVSSKLVSFLKDKNSAWPIMMLRNWIGGSDPDEVVLYHLPESGKCPAQFWKQPLYIQNVNTVLKDLQVVGRAGSEAIGSQVATYDPFLVYVVTKNKNGQLNIELDRKLSKSFNESQNYPWDEKAKKSQVVFFPRPRIIDQKDIEKARQKIDGTVL